MQWRENKEETAVSPAQALEWLKAGNGRFLENTSVNRNFRDEVGRTAKGQHPFAAVLTCIDSRTPPEVLFDQGLGDLFVVRLAGNVVNDDVLASLEFACEVAGARLIVVLGHSRCGAVTGAYDGVELGHLPVLLSKIRPAIDAAKGQGEGTREGVIARAIERHAEAAANEILERSAVLRRLVERGDVGLVHALYSVESGAVRFSALRLGVESAEGLARSA